MWNGGLNMRIVSLLIVFLAVYNSWQYHALGAWAATDVEIISDMLLCIIAMLHIIIWRD